MPCPALGFRRKPSPFVAVDIISDVGIFYVPAAVTLPPTTGAPSTVPALLVLQTRPRDHSRQGGSVLSASGFQISDKLYHEYLSLDVVALPLRRRGVLFPLTVRPGGGSILCAGCGIARGQCHYEAGAHYCYGGRLFRWRDGDWTICHGAPAWLSRLGCRPRAHEPRQAPSSRTWAPVLVGVTPFGCHEVVTVDHPARSRQHSSPAVVSPTG